MQRAAIVSCFRRLLEDLEDVFGPVPVGLQMGPASRFPKRRNYAYCYYEGPYDINVVISPKFLRASPDRVEALLRHELGHAVEFHLGTDGLKRWARQNRLPLPRGVERRADSLAEIVWGDPIRYDKEMVQSLETGTYPRPRKLGL